MRKVLTILFSISLLQTSLVSLSSTSATAAENVEVTSTPSPLATASATPEAKVSDGTYVVGDTGPGGGFIFYVDKKGFKCGPKYTKTGSPTGGLCHYLEAAPSGWKSGKSGDSDPALPWAILAKSKLDADDVFNDLRGDISSSGIGFGYKNSIGIVKQGNDATTAAGASRAYRGGSKSDWYLPSIAELNQLCKWAKDLPWKSNTTVCNGTPNTPWPAPARAGFLRDHGYWSSSEAYFARDPAAWRRASAWTYSGDPQDTGNDPIIKIKRGYKESGRRVHPIRAF